MLTGSDFSGPVDAALPLVCHVDRREPAERRPRTYEIRTHGCQMNVHDSERLAGLLETAGYRRAADGGMPDVVVFNTCAVRENAENRLYGSLGHLRPTKGARPGMQIAVGLPGPEGPARDRPPRAVGRRGVRHPQLGALPVLLERAWIREEAQVEIVDALQTSSSHLPTARDSAYAAWVSISVGCNNTCTFCDRAGAAGQGGTGDRGRSWPRSRCWSPTGFRRSPRWGRT